MKDKVMWLADKARKRLPSESYSAKMYDFVKAEYLKNPNIDDWEKVTQAHKEVLGEVLPAATLVEVSNLIGPHLLIEIEAEACKS